MSNTARYLLAIYIVECRQPTPVSFGSVAEVLDRSPAAVTEMCKRLDGDGLVNHEPYDGVTLTEEGRALATDLHETYVTLSWFFRDVLDLEDHEAEAMEMAGSVSPEVAKRLATTLLAEDPVESAPGSDGGPA